ncbi:MAG: molybdate ABC transporter substrate-binding protein [Chloroflexi bacterium]|nr:molybdate ABC transporter substrate-binding protein [Chloroflexota bacterium]
MLRVMVIGMLICTAGCGPQAGVPTPAASPVELTVFAAASLTDAFTEIGAAFAGAHPGTKITFNFGGSQTLRTQLEQGAVADVFASASKKDMDAAVTSGLVADGEARVFVRNRLVVIAPKSNPAGLTALEDLARPGVKIVLAAENVPVGGYARQALANMSQSFGAAFKDRVLANVVSDEDNVKQVVAKVRLGEADAGIVYTSDVTPAVAPQVVTLAVPDEFNVVAAYPMAVLKSAPHSDLAAGFVKYVLASEGQAALAKWGFIPVRP